jgi:hypothetical protein
MSALPSELTVRFWRHSVAKGKCKLTDCTVSATGTCLLNRTPETCENFVRDKTEEGQIDSSHLPHPTSSDGPKPRRASRTFHSGQELGTQDAAELMRSRYVHLIGILGCTDAGKTCFMSSLYLLASCHDLLPRYRFAASLTLQGFEDRVRRLRKWVAGVLPKKLADHTILSDSRNPSLLHIALREAVDHRRRFDLLLTDLPGEWTKSLIDNAEAEKRFRFLHRADGIIIVIDGPALVSDRHGEIFHAKLLLSRLAESIKLDPNIPIIILISKCDKLEATLPPDIQKLVDHGVKLGFAIDVIMAAAFSSVPDKIANGTGVIAAIEKILGRSFSLHGGESKRNSAETRSFQRFRFKEQQIGFNEK